MYVNNRYPFHDNSLWETQKAIIDALEPEGRVIL